MKRLAIFDYHGTLIWALDVHNAAYRDTVKQLYGVDGSIHDAKNFAASTVQLVTKEIAKSRGVPEDVITSHYNEILPTYEKNFISLLEKMKIRVLPGIPELLKGLKDSGVAISIATGDSERTIDALLRKAKLNDYFENELKVYASIEPPITSRQELVQRAIELAEGKYRRFGNGEIFLFDDSTKGLSAGKELGLVTVGVGTGPEGYEKMLEASPDFAFKDFSNYREVIDIVLGYR